MFNTLKKRIKNEKGLSLVELLAVIVILAIVAAIAIPAIGNIIDNSRIKALKSDAATIISAANIYYTDGNEDDFEVNGTDGTGDEFVQLSSTPSEIKVTKDGKISGSLNKSNITLTFSSATMDDINIDNSDENGDFVKIGKD